MGVSPEIDVTVGVWVGFVLLQGGRLSFVPWEVAYFVVALGVSVGFGAVIACRVGG